MRLLLWLAVASTAVGCAADVEPVDPATVDLHLGMGQAAFEPLMDGGQLGAHAGFQRGFHVFLGVRVSGVRPTDLQLDYAVIPVDTGEVAAERSLLVTKENTEGSSEEWERVGDAVVFGDFEHVRGKDATVRATLHLPGGSTRTEAVLCTLVDA